jgi:hypothetical protein
MRKALILLILFAFVAKADAQFSSFSSPQGQSTSEEDGSPDLLCLKYLFSNGTVTDNADGTCSITNSGGGSSDHGGLTGLLDDDHSQYLLLNGRSGGQVAYGGTDVNNSLSLFSNSNTIFGEITFEGGGEDGMTFNQDDFQRPRMMIGGDYDPSSTVTGLTTGVLTFIAEAEVDGSPAALFGAYTAGSTGVNQRTEFFGAHGRGTLSSPTESLDGDEIFRVSAVGHNTSNTLATISGSAPAAISFIVDGNASATTLPARITFVTTNSSGTFDGRATMRQDGKFILDTGYGLADVPTPLGWFHVVGQDTTTPTVVFEADSSQTANILELHDSSSNILARFNESGNLIVGGDTEPLGGILKLVVENDSGLAAFGAWGAGSGNTPTFFGLHGRGTLASPTESQDGDQIFNILGKGYDSGDGISDNTTAGS